MNKHFFLAALVAGALVACKKNANSGPANSGSSNTYHFTANLDGKNQDFNFNLVATRANNSTLAVTIVGYTSTSGASSTQGFGVTWGRIASDSVYFVVGTWVDTSRVYGLGGIWQPSYTNNTDLYESGTNVTGQAFHDGVQVNQFKLIITQMDTATVTGTFSGDFFENGLLANTKKTIYGDFYVHWK